MAIGNDLVCVTPPAERAAIGTVGRVDWSEVRFIDFLFVKQRFSRRTKKCAPHSARCGRPVEKGVPFEAPAGMFHTGRGRPLCPKLPTRHDVRSATPGPPASGNVIGGEDLRRSCWTRPSCAQ
jgi:hypothetical protein